MRVFNCWKLCTCLHTRLFFVPPSLVCFRRAVEILSKPNYRSADSVTMHCRQTGKKNLSNFELEFKKKEYSCCIPSAVISGLVLSEDTEKRKVSLDVATRSLKKKKNT